ncbi:hypothetical protein LSUE1_G000794, partial [Lachnellula suecica]
MPSQRPDSKVPKSWAPELPYLTAPAYSRTLTTAHLAALRNPTKDSAPIPTNTPKGACSLVKITPIISPSHPAAGQRGLFANCDLKQGTFILQYIGELHATPSTDSAVKDDAHADSNYDLSLDRENSIGIDADKMGNEARFINDYRGIADRPNA